VTGTCVVRAVESLLARMIFNLILNAAEATGKGGKIEIRLRRAESMVCLEVHDNGPGIPVDMRQKVFDPFYTSKPNGTGLGLLSVRMCAVEHHGTVTVTDSDLGGACFIVTLPAAEPPL
jgi:signal transduction histidine kinase